VLAAQLKLQLLWTCPDLVECKRWTRVSRLPPGLKVFALAVVDSLALDGRSRPLGGFARAQNLVSAFNYTAVTTSGYHYKRSLV
jgi:hypothetical protein